MKRSNKPIKRGNLGSIWPKKADLIVRITYDERGDIKTTHIKAEDGWVGENNTSDKCTCESANEEHPCPYSDEMADDPSECTCCPYCTEQCAGDI